ncbi:MAG: hypothetical protein RL662_1446, partial [Bacteroidota bacterium]
VFSETDVETLDLIFDTYNSKSPFDLSEYSHTFPEWLRFEEKLNQEGKPNRYTVDVSDFFQNVQDESKLFDDDVELLSLTKELYESYS